MITFLTVYFWCMLLYQLWNTLRSLTTQPAFNPDVENPRVSQKSAAAIALLGGLLAVTVLGVPLTYLQALALPDLGLPAWLAWAVLAFNLVLGLLAMTFKKGSVSGSYSPLMLPGLALAWHGLRVLGGVG